MALLAQVVRQTRQKVGRRGFLRRPFAEKRLNRSVKRLRDLRSWLRRSRERGLPETRESHCRYRRDLGLLLVFLPPDDVLEIEERLRPNLRPALPDSLEL